MSTHDISLERFLLILRARYRLVLSVFAVCVGVALLITMITPKMYTATASLNFDFRGNPLADQSTNLLKENTYISTQKGIIESLHVAQEVESSFSEYERERVIAALNAKSDALSDLKRFLKSPLQSLFEQNGKEPDSGQIPASKKESLNVVSAYNWLARALGSDLTVEPMFNSRIVRVSYASTDREVAALLANRYADTYISTNLQMMTDPARKSKEWFDQQLSALRERLEESQTRLTSYQQQQGIVSSDERLNTENARLSDLSKQLLEAQRATRNAETERDKLREVLASGESLMTFGPVFSNPTVQKVKAEIRDLESTRVQLSSTLGSNHPKMKKIGAEISAAERRLDSEIKDISEGIDNAAELSRKRELQLEQAMGEQKNLVLSLKDQHDKIMVLQREVESAQATYNAALDQLNTTSMQSLVDQTSVSIVDAANVPSRHSSPKITLNILLGGLAGLIIGIALALLLELFSKRVYSSEDLVSELGVPMIGRLKKAQ